MGKFKFSDYTPAKVANPAKVPINKGDTSCYTFAKVANVEQKKEKKAEKDPNISNFSKSLASLKPFKINDLSNISNFSRGQGINPEKKDTLFWQDSAKLQPQDNPIHPETCPAKCKRSSKCYGIAYFDGKPGKSSICVPDCPWAEQLTQYCINKKED